MIDQYERVKFEVKQLEDRQKRNQHTKSKLEELSGTDDDTETDDTEKIEEPKIEPKEEPKEETKIEPEIEPEQIEEPIEEIIDDFNKRKILKKYETEIRSMLREFKDNVHMLLLEFNDVEILTKKDIDEINEYHLELSEVVVANLRSIYAELPDDLDFSEKFYNQIDKVLIDTENKINKFIED